MKQFMRRSSYVIIGVLALLAVVTYSLAQEKKLPWKDKDFEAYLTLKGISFFNGPDGGVYADSIRSDSLYDNYYLDFIKYEKKVQLEANPYLKLDKVYIDYNNAGYIEFFIYSDQETFCMTVESVYSDKFSISKNGVVKILKPIYVEHYGEYKIEDNIIKSRKYISPPVNKYNYLNGTIKNDTIHFTEKFTGTSVVEYKKQWLTKTRKTDSKIIYEPTLKAEKKSYILHLVAYKVTGEFTVEALKEK